jgi:ribosome-associated toxin RatA of RatAB toxin-antitoxin module
VVKQALVFLLVMSFNSSAGADQIRNSEKMSRLLSGSILHEYTRMDESGGAIRAEVLMHARVEDVWAILQGCGKAFVFVDGMEQCEILERTDQYALIHQVVDTGLLAPTLDYRYESENQAYTRMEFSLVEGNLRVLQGNWEFEKVTEGLLVTYNMRVRPGFPVPRFLVRMSLRRMIPDMLACIRGLVDGSGSSDKTGTDLSRCPGDV